MNEPLGLEWIEAFRKGGSSSARRAGVSTEIDVGSFGFGRDYYFMVTNSGNKPVHDVHVTLDAGDQFYISPSVLPYVSPGVDAAVMPLVRLSVDHGNTPDGLGGQPLLEPRDYLPVIRLEGEIRDGRDSTMERVTLRRTIRMKALVTDVTFYDATGEIDLTSAAGSQLRGGFEAPGFVRYYYKTGRLSVVNTGNVPVGIRYLPSSLVNIPDEQLVAPGDTLFVPADSTGWIRVARAPAVRDPYKLRLYSNGYSYFLFTHEEDDGA